MDDEDGLLQEPPLSKGDVVYLSTKDRMVTGLVARAYPMEDKYTIRPQGMPEGELRGEAGAFLYFHRRDLRLATPSANSVISAQPTTTNTEEQPRQPEPVAQAPVAVVSSRRQARVKWFNKEKGYGKIQPVPIPGAEASEELFVHKSQIDGGITGVTYNAMDPGVFVTYEMATGPDGKPCAGAVRCEGLHFSRIIAEVEAPVEDPATLHRFLMSGIRTGVHQVKGHGKASMEDRFCDVVSTAVDEIGNMRKKAAVVFFGVFDGHAGGSCSEFVMQNLDRSVVGCLRDQRQRDVNSEMAVKSALQAAFRMTEHNFFQYANKLEGGATLTWATAGSTACTATMFGPDEEGKLRLLIANLGDTRAVLGKKDGRAIRLSEDHHPNLPTERRRIELHGGSVACIQGIWRVVLRGRRGQVDAGLSVSRSFGDVDFKIPAEVVSPVPEILSYFVNRNEDAFIVIASDGIWGAISDQEAVRLVSRGLQEGGEDPPKNAARRLVEAAHERDPPDDKTALVVMLSDTVPTAAPQGPRRLEVHDSVRMAPTTVQQKIGPAGPPARGAGDIFSEAPTSADMDMLDSLFDSYAKDISGPAKKAQRVD
eukprot:gnl/TRDRNA2_/TRDRNA2_82593_c0_seq1.p1 gnl/TRDRNA2_/TRDRNA2_82593_c0~~gnl/TRDRNA2_/TRDRNA2_82593_c0_seq1.p1  ORF type:complete len:628 (-),score=115.59 gnl/TRDRNA2_/TRDRNA2_82593_c0_seq1:95-1876(-)